MVEFYRYHARCNQSIHAHMISVMGKATVPLWEHETHGYFSTIGEILTHCYIGDISWLTSFRTVKLYSIFTDSIFAAGPQWGEALFPTIAAYRERRAALDGLILRLTDEIEPSDLQHRCTRVNRRGEQKECLFWKALMHMFNHQTHHRGQVSEILDELKIENDYSNMILIE